MYWQHRSHVTAARMMTGTLIWSDLWHLSAAWGDWDFLCRGIMRPHPSHCVSVIVWCVCDDNILGWLGYEWWCPLAARILQCCCMKHDNTPSHAALECGPVLQHSADGGRALPGLQVPASQSQCCAMIFWHSDIIFLPTSAAPLARQCQHDRLMLRIILWYHIITIKPVSVCGS